MTYQHVSNLWDSNKAATLDPVAALIYRSNLLGSDQRITNTGGGNTSAKLREPDPLTGQAGDVLWVKGSGWDLRTATKGNFASLSLGKVLGLEGKWKGAEARGVKSPIEDWMVGAYPHCTHNLNPCAASIDTPLHAFIASPHVDHTHPNAVIAVAASKRGRELTKEIWGGKVGWTDWQRPGFDLGLKLRDVVAANPGLSGIILGQHGLINWADTNHGCYTLSLDLIEQAAAFIATRDKGEKTFGGAAVASMEGAARDELLFEVVPWLRGMVSKSKRQFATFDGRESVVRFVNSKDAGRLAELGTSCPDHFLRTKIKPLLADWAPSQGVEALKAALSRGLEQYRKDYAAYYERCKRSDSPAMRDPNPTVILIPGVGMVAFGKTKSESRVTAEFYACAVEVMRGAEAMDEYIALPQQEAFDIEYWLLEEAKLKRMPAEKEMARHVVVVVGAGNGIGKATAHRLAKEGAHVVCADLSEEAARAAAKELTDLHGVGIGVSGTGISGSGPAIGLGVDMTKRESVRAMFKDAVLAYGGVDSVVVTAGIYIAPNSDGSLAEELWRKTFDVNVIGMHTVADEARKVWARQGLKGSLVLTTSVNGVVPKKGSLAYDTSKAAANHLVRELAIELAPNIRVNGVAPATVVEGSTMFPRDRVIASLTKYAIAHDAGETTESLRSKLADFYAQRTLLKAAITPADQAEAAFFLASDRSSRTTGQIIHVDGGLHEAFMR